MKLYLVRHGETGSNIAGALDTAIPGADLSDTGRTQAEGLARRFAAVPLEALYVSPLVRTHQTAAPLAQARELTPTILDGLREIGAGDYEMRTDTEAVMGYVSAVSAWLAGDTEVRMAGGESGDEFLARYDAAIETIVTSGVESALLISHGAAIRTWIERRCDISAWDVTSYSSMPNTGVIELEGTPGEWTVLSWTRDASEWETSAG